MGNKYYYLIASLPYLFFDSESPITIEDFFGLCRVWLSKRDYRILREAHLKEWEQFNNRLKKELANIRAAKKFHPEEKIHSEILAEPNPLLMEKRYERIRWDFLEGLEFHYFFDINWLVIYLCKLYILERLATFNKQRGMQVFEEICEAGSSL